MKKKFWGVVAALALTFGMSVTAYAAEEAGVQEIEAISEDTDSVEVVCYEGEVENAVAGSLEIGYWEKDSKGWWFRFRDGGYAKDEFMQIDNAKYYFDKNGYMKTGWLFYGQYWLYFHKNGAMCNAGWQKINDKWYYFIKKGDYVVMDPNTMGQFDKEYTIDGKTYYFLASGVLKMGWVHTGGWRYYGNDGRASEWTKINNKWYYFDPSDHDYAVINKEIYIHGKWYRFNEDGVMQTGWVHNPKSWMNRGYSEWSYYDADGAAHDGWVKSGGKWYYTKGGVCYRNTSLKIDGKYYTFDKDGVWVK